MSYYQGPNPKQNPNEYGQGYSSSPQQPNGPQQQGNAQPYNQPQGGYYQPGGAGNPDYQQQQPYGNNNPYYNPPPNNQQQQWFGGQQRSSLTSLGLDPRLESVLCYALGWLSGLILLFVEKQNREVRYHALQSVIIFGGLNILVWVLGAIPIISFLLVPFLWFVTLAAWIGLMVTAYINYPIKIPVVSEYADRYVDRIRV
ncbi:MAG TPA: hypothetical protein VH593_28050 [Ktedonobacteraceae bacterium]